MRRVGPRRTGVGRRRWLAALALAAIAPAGCAALVREALDVPPGQQPVVGAVSISGLGGLDVVLDIAREDGSYRLDLTVDGGRRQFLITLPPGRYQIPRFRMNESRATSSGEVWFRLGVQFEVGGTPVYVGTLRIERVVFGRELRITVLDEYERTVPAMRARYPELPPVVARALMRPA